MNALWIDYLRKSQSALRAFESDVDGIRRTAMREVIDQLISGSADKARVAAGKVVAMDELIRRLNVKQREETAHAEYIRKTKGEKRDER